MVKLLDYKNTSEIQIPKKIVDTVIGQDESINIIKKAALQRRHVLLIGEPGCLIGDERLFLGNGTILKIKDFGYTHLQKIRSKIMIGRGHNTAVATVFHKYKNQPVIEIVTASGKSIKGTYNHPILTIEKKSGFLSGGSPRKWKRLDQIKEGERVAVVSGVRCTITKYIKTNFSTITRKKNGPKFKGKLPKTLTPNLASLFGYILGDGWVASRKERIGFVVSEDEKEILQELLFLVKNLFGIEPPLHKRIRKERNLPLYYVEIHNKDIYQNLKFLEQKRAPDLILQSGNEVVASFLKWLFTADGTVYNKGRGRRGISLKSKNIELLRDVQVLLLRFGIFSNIFTLYGKSKKNDLQLHIRRGYDIIKFHKKIGFACQKKINILNSLAKDASRFARVRKQIGEKVVKIIKCGFEDVFDIEVPGVHRFIANGIISHNTGKSMIGQALAELLPKEKLTDILVFPNEQDENTPLIRVVPKGDGSKLVTRLRLQSMSSFKNQTIIMFIVIIIVTLIPYYLWKTKQISDIIYAASMITSMMFLVGFIIFINIGRRMKSKEVRVPKLLIDNSKNNQAPFIEATGAHAGALLGDILHDPLQSGGLGTPAHERVTVGLVHKANGGVLFIDEISTLQPHTQQELLSAMQEKKYPITGQSERSSGAMTRTEPIPTDFILIAAGNLEAVRHMHPALRSRIRGYGYEVYMNETMDDNIENQNKLVQFVAQEVVKDKKIPHFTKEAVNEIINESRKIAGISGKLTVRLRELGGLVRAAGDIAREQKSKLVERKHILMAKKFSRPLEQQLADKYIENKKKYQVIRVEGKEIGRVNGLAVIGSGTAHSGILLPIESEVTPGGKKADFVATGKLGIIAKEAVKNVSAIILKKFGEDIKEKYDIYIQFLQTVDSGVEGDSASIAVATAIISALKEIPVRQDTAMTGSLSVRGEVLAIGGVTAKVEAAMEAGIKRVIIPKTNEKDLMLSKNQKEKIKIITAETINDVLKEALVWKGKESILRKIR